MPTYEYSCEKCKISWEKKKTFAEHEKDNRSDKCEKCGSKIKSSIFPVGLKFGKGFYNTGGY